ncbi:hypothetical protein BCR35DRAFT_24182 [Leucosporidium creatinivorum]|uniref:Uncharacterized protein n=1 Tax=Leucosporidium creatinivorum TaxID=106004 RepID=A0A1Y2FYA1_9BASI|nr:hypothetical protein BCR35DRAFT_24182 [Leucosporidium creatinivorum]
MAPSRSQTSSALSSYFTSIDGDLQLASILAFQSHLQPSTSSAPSNKSHAIELVLWVEEEASNEGEDVRKKFSVASVELEPLEVVAQSFGGAAKDVEGFRRMLLAKGEKRGQKEEEEGAEVYTIVVFAIYPRPPSPGSAPPNPSDAFSLIRVLNYSLPTPFPAPPELLNPTTELEDWRHILARGVLEPWKVGTKVEVVAQMAVLRGMERQQLTETEREKRDQAEFKHLTRHLLHVAAPTA